MPLAQRQIRLPEPAPTPTPAATPGDAPPSAANHEAPPAAARAALALHAAMLSCTRRDDAAQAGVRELASRLGLARVSLALADGLVLRLVAVSDGSGADDPTPVNARLLAALGETFDQRAGIVWPAADTTPPGAVPRITLAHRALAAERGSAAGVPLVVAGQAIGALCIERAGPSSISADDLHMLEHLACLAAPVLALMQANERAWPRRAADGLRAWFAADGPPRRRLARRAGMAGAALAAALLLLPANQPVGGRARLEGAVQRVMAAPADGFVAQVHARPGDVVRAGQPLVDLADQDLQLERQRWQSQLAQHLDAYAAAQARSDRSLLVQHQSKADEAQAQLDLVDERLQRSRLVAPFDAIVVQGDLSQQLGAPVKQGAELMTLAPGGEFRVIVEIDERDVALVRAGQTGTVALTSLPWNTLPLRVTRITPMATPVEGRNVFEVEASLLAPTPGLRPGLQGSAQIGVGPAPTLWRWTRRLVESLRLTVWEWFG